MERSSRVLQHGNPKIWKFFQKSLKFEFWLVTKTCTYMMASGMHRRPFEGRHLVHWFISIFRKQITLSTGIVQNLYSPTPTMNLEEFWKVFTVSKLITALTGINIYQMNIYPTYFICILAMHFTYVTNFCKGLFTRQSNAGDWYLQPANDGGNIQHQLLQSA